MSKGLVLHYLHYAPAIGGHVALAGRAALIGRTAIGAHSALRDCATLRADGESVRVGRNAWFGEHATAHVADQVRGTVIGDDVTLGRCAIAHACTLGDGVVLGESAAVMDDASVGDGAVIAGDAIVPPRKQLPGGHLYAGHPARPVRAITREEATAYADGVRREQPARELASQRLPAWLDVLRALPGGEAGLHEMHGRAPRRSNAYVAPSATVAGGVEIHDDGSVFFGCVVCARDGRIVVGERTNVQDNCMLETDARRGELLIGVGVTIGHNVQLGSGTIEDDALIGMGSRVGDGVVVERGACIGAGAWVAPGARVRAGWIWAGRPARAFREVRPEERLDFARARDIYVGYSREYRRSPAQQP